MRNPLEHLHQPYALLHTNTLHSFYFLSIFTLHYFTFRCRSDRNTPPMRYLLLCGFKILLSRMHFFTYAHHPCYTGTSPHAHLRSTLRFTFTMPSSHFSLHFRTKAQIAHLKIEENHGGESFRQADQEYPSPTPTALLPHYYRYYYSTVSAKSTSATSRVAQSAPTNSGRVSLGLSDGAVVVAGCRLVGCWYWR